MKPYFNSERYKNTRKRIENAFNFVNCDFDQVPLIIQTTSPVATGQNKDVFPGDYFTNPQSMLDFQESRLQEHLEKVDDDYVPYLWPWFGVCVIPDYFGSKIIFPENADPGALPVINTIEEAKNLKLKRFEDADLMGRVINTINYFKEHSEYPVSVTDTQSTLDCLTQIIGYQNLFYWMKDDPMFVKYLLGQVNNTLRDWIKYQKKIIGEKNNCTNGIISIKPPEGIGIWLSDDDMTILSPDLYEKFIVEVYSSLFKDFGGAILHWCGNGNHQLDNVVSIKGLKGVHNLFLGDIKSAAALQERLKKHNIPLIIGDIVPVDEQLDSYLRSIKERLDPAGLIFQFWIYSKLGLKDGRYVETDRNLIDTALRILDFFRG